MKDIDKYINSVIKIQYIIRNYIKQLHKLPLIILYTAIVKIVHELLELFGI